jgi:hypothetical protein
VTPANTARPCCLLASTSRINGRRTIRSA